VSKPVNVVMTHVDPTVTAAQLSDAGVKRISVGGSLSRFALGAFLQGAREMKEQGAFTFIRNAAPSKELKAAFARGAAADAKAPLPAQP
jgi:2-methylisocitrate lyase-like PEP mutase family enzyme